MHHELDQELYFLIDPDYVCVLIDVYLIILVLINCVKI